MDFSSSLSFLSSPSMVWLVLMIVLLIVEAIIPGLVSIWFAFGSLVSMVSAMLKAPLWLQIALFIIASAVSLFATRPLVKKYINSKTQPTNADMIIGKECIVTEKVDNLLGVGAVKVGGKIWSAVSSDDEVRFEKGQIAVVDQIKGVKAVIKSK